MASSYLSRRSRFSWTNIMNELWHLSTVVHSALYSSASLARRTTMLFSCILAAHLSADCMWRSMLGLFHLTQDVMCGNKLIFDVGAYSDYPLFVATFNSCNLNEMMFIKLRSQLQRFHVIRSM